MTHISILASAAGALALSAFAAQAATVTLPQHGPAMTAGMSGNKGIAGTWLTTYDGQRNTFTQWRKDGTASQIIDFAPKTGNAQLGDWKVNGDGTVSLYLIGWSFDDKGNALTGYFTKTETDTVSGNSYSGNFEVTFYDLGGNIVFQHDGTLTATRVGQ
ncbi:MAG: hypothetical protein JO208_00050 [Alphaproteobacteria bacterium]|nr:hypothetical protein [Alphaproteobacteria bacterium]